MPQKYKVYIKDKVIIFRKSKTALSETENQMVYNEPSLDKLKEIVSKFEKKKKVDQLILQTTEPKTAFICFAKDYNPVIAAGGIVRNDAGEILMIFRKGKWDLPKGKRDKGEKPGQTAIREVMEETGISDIRITKKLDNTYHIYKERKQPVLKKTVWYEMYSNDKNLKPQIEEDISEVKWFKTTEIDFVLKNTFLSVFKLISKYRKGNHF
jgi:ADP-ribose pyrophosphatase YjhB (NUDIX family)